MEIKLIKDNKKQFLDLLLLADEDESMIDKYLGRGDLFALYDGDLKSICVVADEGDSICELKNLATYEQYQRHGYAKTLIDYVGNYYKSKFGAMLVGTGDVPGILDFYRKCGFANSHRIKDFFTDNYDHAMFENGIQLKDMVYLKKTLISAGFGE